jgi:hypothetical protein
MLYLHPYLRGPYVLQVEHKSVTEHNLLLHSKDVCQTGGQGHCVINNIIWDPIE